MNNVVVALLKEGLSPENRITDGLTAALEQMETRLEAACESCSQQLEADLKRVVISGGKRLRPILSYLGYAAGRAEAKSARPDFDIVPLMTAAELVHTSSLIHDDIVDRADVRRSVPTINATSGDHAAVQAGDFLLAKASLVLAEYQGLGLEKEFGSVASAMCMAEFMQFEYANRFDEDSLDHYFRQIENKTAKFLSAVVAVGGKAGGASEETVRILSSYGSDIGMAFQLRDDMLDFASDEGFGKKLGIDLERGLFTLPLILALTEHPSCMEDELDVKAAVKKAVRKEKTQTDITELLQFVKGSDALKQTQELIGQYTNKAIETIKQLEESDAREALILLAESLAVRTL